MAIRSINFPIYGIIIVLSIGMGMFYIYKTTSKDKRKNLYLYFILYLTFSFVFGKIYTIITSKEKVDLIEAGISSLGGAIGSIIAAYIFEKIENHDKSIIKHTILSLPLVYSISKIACHLVGCCYGIPYKGIGYVIYLDGLKEKLFPIQLIETIVFFLLFLLLNKYKESKEISYITILSCAIGKLLLDFLRYDHESVLLTSNQIVCFLFVIITFYLWMRKRKEPNK